MTVQELIDELLEIEDKSKLIKVRQAIDGDFDDLDEVDEIGGIVRLN